MKDLLDILSHINLIHKKNNISKMGLKQAVDAIYPILYCQLFLDNSTELYLENLNYLYK